MRADRLIALLLLLQRRERVTVAEAADALEVSPRTIRRDFEALAMAGVPVYSRPGPGGGWQLIGGASTDLSGLNRDEARTLLAAVGSARNWVNPESALATTKLVKALPEPFREEAHRLANTTMVDEHPWARERPNREQPAVYEPIAAAIAERRKIVFTYRETTRCVSPLALVRKSARWYLLADGESGRRVFRLDRIANFRATDDPATVPPDFNLDDAWAEVIQRLSTSDRGYFATGRILDPGITPHLTQLFGRRITVTGDTFRAGAMNHNTLVGHLLCFGDRIWVESPAETRAAVAERAASVVALYRSNGAAAEPADIPGPSDAQDEYPG